MTLKIPLETGRAYMQRTDEMFKTVQRLRKELEAAEARIAELAAGNSQIRAMPEKRAEMVQD